MKFKPPLLISMISAVLGECGTSAAFDTASNSYDTYYALDTSVSTFIGCYRDNSSSVDCPSER